MDKLDVKFGEWIEQGFSLYKENFGILVLVSLIAVIVSGITVGVLAGPMTAGVLLIVFQLHDRKEPQPEVGNLLRGFDFFLNSFLFFVIWGMAIFVVSLILGFVPCIGQLASLFVVFVAHALLMFGMFLIVDQKMEFWAASVASFNMVKRNFWPFLGFSIVSNLIGGVGAVACGIGVVFTLPIQVCILTVAYREIFDGGEIESLDS
eukprot:TRINITY_DN15176_c0_g1_i1.p2 TRINITY_DN15176_c0_g1~~TRINITY_DN15176_c0_g1_i1.p2  ORF type:complete len:206 (-),score=15.97 TRINITY_DN15176_c0_g1_i1:256-873(-)